MTMPLVKRINYMMQFVFSVNTYDCQTTSAICVQQLFISYMLVYFLISQDYTNRPSISVPETIGINFK